MVYIIVFLDFSGLHVLWLSSFFKDILWCTSVPADLRQARPSLQRQKANLDLLAREFRQQSCLTAMKACQRPVPYETMQEKMHYKRPTNGMCQPAERASSQASRP